MLINNLSSVVFGGTRNAEILSEELTKLGDAKLAWKLKKKFCKTMQTLHQIERAPSYEVRTYLKLLVYKDTVAYVDTLDGLPMALRKRFLAAVRNATYHEPKRGVD